MIEAAAAIAVVSPITGELIPVHEMYKHMRISVNDPKYKEQKERLFGKIRETTLAQDDVISRSIVGLARTRPDIFGTTEEEFSNAVTAEIQSKNGVLGFYWHMATQAMSAQEPEPKRQRLDDSLLFPENQFLAQHPGPVCISVWVPEKGQMLELSVESLSESVSSLKEKIAGEIEKAPPANKLKLSGTADHNALEISINDVSDHSKLKNEQHHVAYVCVLMKLFQRLTDSWTPKDLRKWLIWQSDIGEIVELSSDPFVVSGLKLVKSESAYGGA
ncbi:hypothetical protein L1987_35698 [Smallanthus sonchifolius]|uniref:Uncharacterized protein n=1 Tax=Smallanthus sonchifolius TaxID=185202 RepID=A0ACB9HD44_9ASTR|nr:hypothetical protein L1987_35698 [Smallanthus sonchifolius]